MARNPILDLNLSQVVRPDIAMSLQQVLRVYTVGNLLQAWKDPGKQRRIEEFFESPQQARYAISVCATWLGFRTAPMRTGVPAWWAGDARPNDVDQAAPHA